MGGRAAVILSRALHRDRGRRIADFMWAHARLGELQQAVKRLKRECLALYYVSLDPSVGCMPKMTIALALAYVLSPLDLIPDFIPVVGFLDDLLIVPALIWLALKCIPPEAMDAARHRAENEPVKLTKNLAAAAVFLLIWLASFEAVATLLCEHWPLARTHRISTYATASVMFLVFAFAAVLSESDEARTALRRCCTCTSVQLSEPLLPASRSAS